MPATLSPALAALHAALGIEPSAMPESALIQYPVLSFAGGLNTKSSPLFLDRTARHALQRDQLTLCDNLIRTTSGGLRPRPGYSALNSTAVSPPAGDNTIRDIFELRRTGDNNDLLMHAGNTVYRWSGTSWVSLGTVLTADTRIHWCQHRNRAVGFDGSNTPLSYDGTTFTTLSGSPPTSGTACASYRDRVWVLDGATLRYCASSNPNDWVTDNNAGSLPVPFIRGGSGTGLFPFYDRLLVWAGRELYALVGSFPAAFSLVPVNTAIGHQGSPYGIVAAGNDVYFASSRGAHSVAVTLAQSETGDLEQAYESALIEPTWQEIDAANLANIVAVHDPRHSLVLFLCNRTGTTNAEAFAGDYHHLSREGRLTWSHYTNFPFASAAEVYSLGSGIPEVLLGGYNGIVYRHRDADLDDAGTAIPCQFQYVSDLELPQWEKTFRWLVFYSQVGIGNLIHNVSFDFGLRVLTQTTNLAQTLGDRIGETFTIGTSALGTLTFVPHQLGIPGFGRTITIVGAISVSSRIDLGGFIIYAAPRRLLQGRA